MPTVQEELARYGAKLVARGLAAGTGANISAHDSHQTVWMNPNGFALDELVPTDLCGVHLTAGKQTKGPHKISSEVLMYVAVYRARPDIKAVFHVHPPWLSGIARSGAAFRPLTCEAAARLGRIATVPYFKPTTPELTEAVGTAVRTAETLLLAHHGLLTVGTDVREAYYRCVVAEDAAKSVVAAAAVGTPQYLDEEQIEAIRALGY